MFYKTNQFTNNHINYKYKINSIVPKKYKYRAKIVSFSVPHYSNKSILLSNMLLYHTLFNKKLLWIKSRKNIMAFQMKLNYTYGFLFYTDNKYDELFNSCLMEHSHLYRLNKDLPTTFGEGIFPITRELDNICADFSDTYVGYKINIVHI